MGTHVSWLMSCPCSDANFKVHLAQASFEEIEQALRELPEKGNKSKIATLTRELKRRRIRKGSSCKECGKEHFKISPLCSDKCETSFKEKAKKMSITALQQMAHAEELSYGQFTAKYGL